MSMMANTEAAQSMRIRAEELLERKGTGAPRQAGELAGQFAAMLETLNGVEGSGGEAGGGTTGAVSAAKPSIRLGVGAVSLFAQETGQSGQQGDDQAQQTPDLQPQDPTDALHAVQSALQAGNGSNFRWLTTLMTQSGA